MNLYEITNNQLTNKTCYILAGSFAEAEEIFWDNNGSYKISSIRFISDCVFIQNNTKEKKEIK